MSDKESIEDRNDEGSKLKGRGDLTAGEREERNASIVRCRVRGQSWPYIAKRHNLSKDHCMVIFREWKENHRSVWSGEDPIVIVHRMLDRCEGWIEQLAEIAEEAEHDSARVGAVNSQSAIQDKAAALAQATGLLPRNLGVLRLDIDVRVLAQKLMVVFERHDVSVEFRKDILEVLDGGMSQLPAGGE